jgi:hypothetical protein
MPTRKPRVPLTVPEDLHSVLVELAEVVEKPVSTLIVDLLREMEPQLVDLTRVLRHVKDGKKAAAKRALQHMVGNALAEQLDLIGKKS